MSEWFFASDLHGHARRYVRLYDAIQAQRPTAVFLGGDLFAAASHGKGAETSILDPAPLIVGFSNLRRMMRDHYPQVLVILGNDDPRLTEPAMQEGETDGLWTYVHNRTAPCEGYQVFGYACVPPTPFLLKDWERHDVSRSIDPGCVPPEDGHHTVPFDEREVRYGTILDDLELLATGLAMDRTVCLFHSPPYQTKLDRAALDGKTVDHVPVDVHVGSIAIRRFIEQAQPFLTFHGHVHESARLTGAWRDQIGNTHMFSAAHDGPELALVRLDPDHPEHASRELIRVD